MGHAVGTREPHQESPGFPCSGEGGEERRTWQVWLRSSLTCQLVLFTKMICWGTHRSAGASWLCRLHRGGRRMQRTQTTSPRQQSYGFGLFRSRLIQVQPPQREEPSAAFNFSSPAGVEKKSVSRYTPHVFPLLRQNPAGSMVCMRSFPRICINQAISYCLKNARATRQQGARNCSSCAAECRDAHGHPSTASKP